MDSDLKKELSRKGIHIFALGIPFGILFLPKSVSLPILIGLTVIVVTVEILRAIFPGIQELFLSVFGSLLRKHEKRGMTGSTALFLSSTILILFLNREIAFLSLSCIILGDAGAALVGKNFGKLRIGKKSVEGSITCFAICLLIFFLCKNFLPNITPVQGLVCACATTLLELIPVPLDDNLYVPVISGILLKLI
jgi:dolichol kinase